MMQPLPSLFLFESVAGVGIDKRRYGDDKEQSHNAIIYSRGLQKGADGGNSEAGGIEKHELCHKAAQGFFVIFAFSALDEVL